MATAKVTPFPIPAQAPVIPEAVTQDELCLLLSLRARVRELEEQIQTEEQSLKSRLEAGASVEPGLLRAFLKIVERRSVAWKAVVERELGQDYARRVLAATKPDVFTHLVVEA